MISLIQRNEDIRNIINSIFDMSHQHDCNVGDWRYSINDGVLEIEIDLPGYGKSDIEIESTDNILTILSKEKVLKSIRLDRAYKTDDAKARLKDGRLYVTINRREDTAKKLTVT